MTSRLLLVALSLVLATTVSAQEYNVTMPGQKKVTTVDSTGTITTVNVTDNDSEYIQYRSGTWFYKGETMSESEFLAKMQSECPAAYQYFQSGVALRRTGIIVASVGGATLLVGAGFLIGGAASSDMIRYYNSSGWYIGSRMAGNWAMVAGLSMMVVGTAVGLGAGLPCILVGQNRKHSANQVYNTRCVRSESAVTLRVGFTSSGLGMAVNF